MKARDVLVECWNEVGEIGKEEERALLDCTPKGEGVYIAPDGTLMRVRNEGTRDRPVVDDKGFVHGESFAAYRLVPIEEATE